MLDVIGNCTFLSVDSVLCVRSEKNRRFTMINRSSYALSLCKSGKITYSMNGKEFVSEPTNAVLLPMGGNYSLFGNETGEFPLVNFYADGLSVNEITTFTPSEPAMCLRIFETMERAFLFEKNHLKTMRCLYELAEQISASAQEKNGVLSAAEAYLSTHLCDSNLTNFDVAKSANISEVYLRKAFMAKHGISPHRYILNARIAKAKQLLSSTTQSVGEIGQICGFNDPFHFSRIFRQYVGVSPSDYRKTVRGI